MPAPRWIADRSRDDIVVLHLTGATGEPPDIESFFSTCEELLALRQRIVIVHDLTNASPDAARRQRLLAWSQRNLRALEAYMVAYGVVAPTAMHRGIIVAALWFMKPKQPMQVFGDLGSALIWARGQARIAGLG